LLIFPEEAEEEVKELEPYTKILQQMTMQLQQIITFYKYIKSRFDIPPEYDIVAADNVPSVKNLASILLTSEREIHRIIKVAKILNNFKNTNLSTETKVKFKEDEKVFFDFLSCFEFGSSRLIGLRKDLKEEKIYEICKRNYNM
jgi:hypothetical protein